MTEHPLSVAPKWEVLYRGLASGIYGACCPSKVVPFRPAGETSTEFVTRWNIPLRYTIYFVQEYLFFGGFVLGIWLLGFKENGVKGCQKMGRRVILGAIIAPCLHNSGIWSQEQAVLHCYHGCSRYETEQAHGIVMAIKLLSYHQTSPTSIK